MKKLFRKQHVITSGFSLVEFIVIISIFAIMAGVALFNFGGFSSNISLNNLAHDVALTVRQAQVFGISATEGSGSFQEIRGVHFGYASSGYDSSFVIFLDVDTAVDDNNPHNSMVSFTQSVDVTLDTVTITTQDRILDIETGFDGTSASSCASDVTVAFVRPDPAPMVFCGATQAAFARIILENPSSGNQKYIEIWPTGQIAVVNNPTTGGQ